MSSHLRLNMPRTHLPSETGVNTYPSPSQCMATASFSSLRPMIFGSILTHNLSLKSSIYSIRQSCGTYLQNRSKTNHCSLSGLETSWSGPPSSLPWIPAEANRSPYSFPHPAPTPPPPNAAPRGILFNLNEVNTSKGTRILQKRASPLMVRPQLALQDHWPPRSSWPPDCLSQSCRGCPAPKGLCVNCSLCLECSTGLTPCPPPPRLCSNNTFQETYLVPLSESTAHSHPQPCQPP